MVNSKSNLQCSSRVDTFPAFLYPQLLLLNVAQDYSAPSLWESMQFNCSERLCIFPLSHQLFACKVAAVSFDSLAVCGQLEGTFCSSPTNVHALRRFPSWIPMRQMCINCDHFLQPALHNHILQLLYTVNGLQHALADIFLSSLQAG